MFFMHDKRVLFLALAYKGIFNKIPVDFIEQSFPMFSIGPALVDFYRRDAHSHFVLQELLTWITVSDSIKILNVKSILRGCFSLFLLGIRDFGLKILKIPEVTASKLLNLFGSPWSSGKHKDLFILPF